MKQASIYDWVWIYANGVTAAVFLLLSSREWIEPEVRDIPGASGGRPAVFTLLTAWLLIPLLILNVVWLVVAICRGKQRSKGVSRLRLFGLMAVAWIGLVLFSASRL